MISDGGQNVAGALCRLGWSEALLRGALVLPDPEVGREVPNLFGNSGCGYMERYMIHANHLIILGYGADYIVFNCRFIAALLYQCVYN